MELSDQNRSRKPCAPLPDNGVGFDPEGSFPGHPGLKSMRERAARLGRSLQVHSAPGRGSLICSTMPLTT